MIGTEGSTLDTEAQWAVTAERRYLSEASMKLITNPTQEHEEVAKPALLTA